jgi:hypothetical protein
LARGCRDKILASRANLQSTSDWQQIFAYRGLKIISDFQGGKYTVTVLFALKLGPLETEFLMTAFNLTRHFSNI